jgi:hypothetical protein
VIPSSGTDSAGVPWHGRELHAQPISGDDGASDPDLARAVRAYATGRGQLAELAAGLGPARVFVPIVAVLDGDAGDAHALRTVGDAGADMALITLTGKDGSRALPVFTSVSALAAWDSDARPVPVEAARAAQAAVAEGCRVLLLDLGSAHSVLVPRSLVWALGQGRAWLPPSRDPQVLDGVGRVCASVPEVVGVELEPADGAEVSIVLRLAPGLDRERLAGVAEAVRTGLRASEVVSERAEGVHLRITQA